MYYLYNLKHNDKFYLLPHLLSTCGYKKRLCQWKGEIISPEPPNVSTIYVLCDLETGEILTATSESWIELV